MLISLMFSLMTSMKLRCRKLVTGQLSLYYQIWTFLTKEQSKIYSIL